MTDDKGIVRAYSQDRQIYRHNSISIKRKTSTQITKTSENYYSNRNCPEILSLFALSNKHLDNRKNEIYRSVSNDTHHFTTVNYPIQSPPPTPISNLLLNNDNQLKFPKVTPRVTPSTTKKFPTLTPKKTVTVDNKKSMPIIKTSVKSTSLSFNKSPQTKRPTFSNDKKKKI